MSRLVDLEFLKDIWVCPIQLVDGITRALLQTVAPENDALKGGTHKARNEQTGCHHVCDIIVEELHVPQVFDKRYGQTQGFYLVVRHWHLSEG